MDQTTTSTQADDGSTGTADKPGTAHRTRRRAFLAMGAAAVLATGAGAGAFASRSGPFAAKAKPTTSTFNGATDTITKGDLQGQTSVTGTLRYSDSRKFKSGFEGVLIQVPASGIDHVVGHLPALIEVQRAENPQCSPVVLLDGDAPVPAPGDPQVQLAGGAHDSRSVMSTSWWIHSMTCSRPSSVLRLVKQKGLSPRNTLESASMTARSAPT